MTLFRQRISLLSIAFTAIVLGIIISDTQCSVHVYGQATFADQAAQLGKAADARVAASDAQARQSQAALADALARIQAMLGSSYIPAGMSLTTLLNNATDNTHYVLRDPKDGATYPPIASPTVRAKNVTLRGWGNHIDLNPPPGSSSGIRVEGSGFEVSGLELGGNNAVAFNVSAPRFIARNLTVPGTTLQEFVHLSQGADDAQIIDCTVNKTGGCGIYVNADNVLISNFVCGGSLGEHCVRFTMSEAGRRPLNGRIVGGHLSNHNPQGKGCLELREIDGLFGDAIEFDGYSNVGQQSADTNFHARHIVFRNCKWLTPRPGGALGQFEHDADVLLDGCSAPGSLTDADFTISARGQLVTRNCTQTGTPPAGKAWKPFAVAFDAATLVQLPTYTPTPATQPSTQPNH